MGNSLMQANLFIWGMYQHADIVARCMMTGLILASVIIWVIFFSKGLEFFTQECRLEHGQQLLMETRSLDQTNGIVTGFGGKSLGAQLISEIQNELRLSGGNDDSGDIKERTGFHLEHRMAVVDRHVNRNSRYLATIGAISPFVDLSGAIWDVMNNFTGIIQARTTNLAVVAPGIAEALLAIAIDLITAVPAVVVYNISTRQIGSYKTILGDVTTQVPLLQSRDLDLSVNTSTRPVRATQKLRVGQCSVAMGFNEDPSNSGGMYEISVTPSIDVMSVLLITFMVTAPLATVGVRVNLPVSTSTPQPRPGKPVYLSVKADRGIFIGNNQVTNEIMIDELSALTDGEEDTTIFFRADKIVGCETMMKVMDILHQAGLLKIGLVDEEAVKAK